MKRLVVNLFFVSFVLVLFSFFVSGQTVNTCPSQTDIILRLSDNTNAHGQEWNVGTYPYQICRGIVSGASVGNGCNSNSNVVVRLKGELVSGKVTNAHAEVPYPSNPVAGYTDICYGNLACTSVIASSICPQGKVEVISLSDSTNAHLGAPGQYTVGPNTPNAQKICCSATGGPGGGTGLSNAQWYNYDQRTVINNLMCPSRVNARVQAGTSISGPVNFQIYDEDDSSADDLIGSSIQGTVLNGQANVTFDLTSTTLASALQTALGESGEGNTLELFFKATEGTNEAISPTVTYNSNPALCTYSKPTAAIKAPKHQGVYFTNTNNIRFEAECTSQVGGIEYEWKIYQEGRPTITKTEAIFTIEPFTNSGHATVRLKCTDSVGSAESEVQILVGDTEKETLAYIENPSFNSFAVQTRVTTPYFPTQFGYSASESFVVEITNNGCTVTCLGGDCPTNTENSPASCATNPVGGPIPILNVPSNPSYTGMTFEWRFWDDDWNTDPAVLSFEGYARYDDVSNNINDKHMSVKVKHTASGAEANFQRNFTLGRCLDNGRTFYGGSGPISTSAANGACKGLDQNSPLDDCCPSGRECVVASVNTQASCQVPNNPRTTCADLPRGDCRDHPELARASLNRDPDPSLCEYFECAWVEGSCIAKVNRYSTQQGGQCGTNSDPTSTCGWKTEHSECFNGQKTITYTLVSGNSQSCPAPNPNPATVMCGSLSFELDFFGRIQFIITSIIIIAIYFVYLGFISNRVKRHGKSK